MTPKERIKVGSNGIVSVRHSNRWHAIVQLESDEGYEYRLADIIAAITEAEADVRGQCCNVIQAACDGCQYSAKLVVLIRNSPAESETKT